MSSNKIIDKNYSKNKHCKCGKKIDFRSKGCASCSQIRQGESIKKHYCKDCNKEIGWQTKSGKCKSCSHKGHILTEEHKNKIRISHEGKPKSHGKCLKDYFCKNCNIHIAKTTFIYGSGYCQKCSKKLFPPMLNKQHTEETRNKISIANKGNKNSPETMFKKGHVVSAENRKKLSLLQGGTGVPYEFAKYDRSIFTEELKESIRKRDNYTCQNCGMTEEEHIIVNGQVLHVHHIDYDKQNCKQDNLITTCQQCNLRANSNRDYWKDFYQNKMEESICQHL